MIQIQKVEPGTELARRMLSFVENCSWTEAKEHIAGNLRNWVFTDWEAFFAAMDGEQIVGMASFMKTDYYPLPEIYPWVSGIFVSEAWRRQRISGRLVDAANEYARSLGFTKTYIPSEHRGLYEKYGYTYVKDIVNYGNGVDHLFEKDLKEK